MIRKLVAALFLTIFAVGALSAADTGVTGAQFLKIGTGARPMGMAGAFGAIADDGYAAYWNPAGFGRLKSAEIDSTYLKYFQDINYGYIGYAAPLRKLGVFGVGISYLVVADIEGRAGDTELPDREFKAHDTCLTVSYANNELCEDICPGLDLGANIKFIKQDIDEEKAQTAALDLGAFYQTPVDPLTIGLCVQNIGPGQKFRKVRDPLPLNVKFSSAYRMFDNKLTSAIEIDQYLLDQKMYAGIGFEYWLFNMIGLRTGYRHGYHRESLGNLAGLAAGASFRAFSFQLDYAFVPFGDLGDTHRFSFSARFK